MKKIQGKSRVLLATFMLGLISNLSLARDPQAFPLPDTLKPDVNFWLKVYTEVTTTEGFIHDNQHLNIIYERVSLSLEPAIKRVKR